MGIHLLIYFINNPKATLSKRRKLAQKNINYFFIKDHA